MGCLKMANEKWLIDVNAVLEKVCENCCCDFEECKQVGFCADYTNIEQLPTVDAVPVVHGRWEDGCAIHNGKKVYDSIDCSVCNEIFKIESHDREYWKNRFKNCPFCGALMDGGNEDG